MPKVYSYQKFILIINFIENTTTQAHETTNKTIKMIENHKNKVNLKYIHKYKLYFTS